MKKSFVFFLGMTLCVAMASLCFGDTVFLKNGKIIKGTVMDEQDNFIKMLKEDGSPAMYFTDEIKRVVKDEYAGLSVAELGKKKERPLSAIPKAKQDLIYKLFEYNGAKASVTQTFKEILKKIDPEQQSVYDQYFSVDEVLEEALPIYDKYYSQEELSKMVNFYGSPTGQKLIEASSPAMDEIIEKMIKYFSQKTAGK